MIKIKSAFLILLSIGVPAICYGQTILSLKDCLELAIENNLQLQSQHNQWRQSQENISENRAKLLPQINGSVTFNDNFKPPVSATDQSAMGVPYNITHTLQYSTGMGISLNMPLYNQTLLTSMELVRLASGISSIQEEKAREDLIVNVAKMYCVAQVTTSQISLLDANIRDLEQLRKYTAAYFENGMVLEVDLQRVDLNISSLRTARDNSISILQQQYNSLKYIMDYPAESEFRVIEVDISDLPALTATGLSNDLPEIRLLNQAQNIAETQLKMARQGYLPSLSLTGFLQWNGWTGSLKRWGGNYPDKKLWNSYGIGLTLRIPIFDGFEKRSKTRKGQLAVEDARLKIEDAQNGLQTQYNNAILECNSALRSYDREKANYELAQSVYSVTSNQYTEGVATMTAVLQDQMNINQAMGGYLKSYLDCRLANITILKLSGQINTLLK